MQARSTAPTTLFLVTFGLAGPASLGQESAPPVTPDESIERRIDEAERLAPRAPDEVEAFSPIQPETTSPIRPGLTGGESWADLLESAWPGVIEPSLRGERTFVNQLRGTVIRGPGETRIFVPTPDADAPPTRAMLLLPCMVLERFDSYLFAGQDRVPVLLTGQVFLYGGRNYVLPTSFRRAFGQPAAQADQVAETPARSQAELEKSDPTEAESGSDGIDDNPDVAALMAELEMRSPLTRPAPAGPASTGRERSRGEESSPDLIVGNDGTYLAARRGRVVRSPNGTWSFILDNGRPSSRVAFTLLPCRTLEGLERQSLRDGDASAGLMSGRVYTYMGNHYLLPTLYQQERRDWVHPLQ